MTRFEKFIPIIFKNEGILSDNVNDSGGLTKYGISQRAYPNLDIRNLTKQQAEEIYKRDYYDVCKIDLIENELLAIHVFDMAVNAGIGRSIRMLQRVILVDVDGVMGEKTINTANSGNWADAFIQARINYYKQIATGRNLVFLNGWLARVQNTTKAL
jgi:lysozyme family protein